jgi:hypothetical protein
LCENGAITTAITAAAKSLAHAVQNAPNRFKTLQNAKKHKNDLSRNLTIMQQITNISARTGKCTAYKRCLHQRQPRTKFGHRPSPVGQSNNTTPPRHAQPNCTMAWQAPPKLHHELDEELDSEDEEEVLLEELCSGWPSSGKGVSGGGSSMRCASITSHGGNNSGSGS